MFAIVHSPNFPVVSVVAVAMNDVLAELALSSGSAGVRRRRHCPGDRLRDDQARCLFERLADAQAREAIQAQVAVQYKRFNNAMDNIVQGLAMYDRSNSLIACNKRYAEIYGLPVELTGPGVTRAQILAYRGNHGFGKALSEPLQRA